jgi:hypothetical protein
MAALSLATDLGKGQPLEHALRSCVLAMRLGDALGLDETTLREVYYQALLRYIGCNVETSMLAAIFGDELTMRADYVTVDAGKTTEVLRFVMRRMRAARQDASALDLIRQIGAGLLAKPQIDEGFSGHYEVAQRLAERLGFDEGIVRALGQLYAC